MLFDATEWSELTANEWLSCITGKLEIRTSDFSVLLIQQMGIEAIASTGHHHKVRVQPGCEYKIAMPGKAKAYGHTPTNPLTLPVGEKFTNIDRKPHESGTLLEVKKAVRELQLRAYAQRQQIQATERKRKEAEPVKTKTPAEPEPETPTEPDPEPQGGTGETPAS